MSDFPIQKKTIECFQVVWMDGLEKLYRADQPLNLTSNALQYRDEKGVTEIVPLYQVRKIVRVTVEVDEDV